MIFSCTKITEQSVWNNIHHEHWQQTWEYGELQRRTGRVVERFIIQDEENQIHASFQVIVYQLWHDYTISYIPYGPMLHTIWEPRLAKVVHAWAVDFGSQHNSICIRMELPTKLPGFNALPWFAYRSSFHQPRGEVTMDIPAEYTKIFDSFSKSTKRNIKKSEKNNLIVDFFHGADMLTQQDLFIALNKENTQSHNTTTHTDHYFKDLFAILSRNPNNFVATVSKDGVPCAINLYTVFNNHAYCPFGASNDDAKQSAAYYFIKWQAMQKMCSQGITQFNWGGISIGKQDHNLSGLNQFKLGFGGKEKHHNDFYDVVLSPLYWIYLLLKMVR